MASEQSHIYPSMKISRRAVPKPGHAPLVLIPDSVERSMRQDDSRAPRHAGIKNAPRSASLNVYRKDIRLQSVTMG